MTNEIKEAITEALELVYLKQLIKGELFKAVNELQAKNDRWITLKPHGKEADDYKRLLIKDGEDIEDAMHRQGYYKKRQVKTEKTLKELQKEKDNAFSEAMKAKKAGDKEKAKEWTKKFWELKEQIANLEKGKPEEKQPEEKKPEKKDEKKIAGVKRGEPMSRANADNNSPNPNYGVKPGCTTNCQTCVVAYEARLRGYNVQALGNYNNPTIKDLSRRTRIAWIDPTTGKHPEYISDANVKNYKQCYSWLEKTIEKDCRYTIEFGWKGRRNSGHIVSIEKDENNKLRLYDPQNGQTIINENELKRYFARFKYQFSTYGMKFPDPPKLLRIDNLEFNTDVVDKILEKSND